MKDFKKEIEEISSLYSKAITEADYLRIMNEAKDLEVRMKKETREQDVAEGVIYGLWAHYYFLRKFFREPKEVKALSEKVGYYFSTISDPELKIKYGCLFAVIASELEHDADKAFGINQAIGELARETGNILSLLRVINSRGIREMRIENYQKAINIFNEIETLDNIPKDCYRLAGHVINNRGASKIRGRIDIISGLGDLVVAGRSYYLEEEEIQRKHIKGLFNRVEEAIKKM